MSETKNSPFSPNYAVAPGAILAEWLQERGMKQTELAERMGRPIKTVSELIHGKICILQETAFQLERVTGIEASFWMNADRIYQERAARLAEGQQMTSWKRWALRFPFREMVDFGWVVPTPSGVARVRALFRYFGVASPDAWQARYGRLQAAFRQFPAFHADDAHLGAWLRQGEIQAARTECSPYNEPGFKDALVELRRATTSMPETFWPELVQKCRGTGVAVVLVPELSQTHVSGATRWLTPTKALIQLSLRYKTDDHLWFTFFHEAAHVLLHGKKDVFVEFNDPTNQNQKEQEADRWAADFLIPPAEWRCFCAGGAMNVGDITTFAARLGISPSIVVGRLQHEELIPFTACNRLKRRLRLVPENQTPPVAN